MLAINVRLPIVPLAWIGLVDVFFFVQLNEAITVAWHHEQILIEREALF